MSDRFRDLEEAGKAGRKDAVLLATVSSFEGMVQPTRHDLHQFTELFIPLFSAASVDARRTAAAALSRCPDLPEKAAAIIAGQPIEIAAPFLARGIALDDAFLISTIASFGVPHAKAIARRETLSPPLVEALISLGDPSVDRTLRLRNLLPAMLQPAAPDETLRLAEEERLRARLRVLVQPRDNDSAFALMPGLPGIDPEIEIRLARYVETGEALYFATALADALNSSFDLAERIMLDVSGHQLAETLVALGLRYHHIIAALERFFPHLASGVGSERASLQVVRACSFADCIDRIAAWQRADAFTQGKPLHVPLSADRKQASPRQGANSAAHAQPERPARTGSRRA